MDYMTSVIESAVKSAKGNGTPEASKISVSGSTVTLNGNFKVEKGLYEILKRNIEKKMNTLLLGETGCGKTEIVSHMADVLGIPLYIVDMGTMTDAVSGLVGIHTVTIVDGKTSSKFKKSRFSDLIQKPGIILLDELSRATAQANNLLFPCLDFRKELSMEYCFEDQTPVKVHPNCVFFATANLGSQYTGTHKIDRALLDRFMTLKVVTPSSEDITSSLQATYNLPPSKIDTIVKVYDNLTKAHNEFKIDFKLSFRHLKFVSELVEDGFTIYDAFYAICNSMTNLEDTKILKDLLDVAPSVTKDDSSEPAKETSIAELLDDYEPESIGSEVVLGGTPATLSSEDETSEEDYTEEYYTEEEYPEEEEEEEEGKEDLGHL